MYGALFVFPILPLSIHYLGYKPTRIEIVDNKF